MILHDIWYDIIWYYSFVMKNSNMQKKICDKVLDNCLLIWNQELFCFFYNKVKVLIKLKYWKVRENEANEAYSHCFKE